MIELVISHRGGSSGNFIGFLYANKEVFDKRIVRADAGSDNDVLTINGRLSWEDDLKNLRQHKIIVTHQFDKELINKTFPTAKHVAIWPYTKQMNVIWNIHHKKNPVLSDNLIDYYYTSLKNWHQELHELKPEYSCFDYGQLNHKKYVESMLDITFTDHQQNYFDNYWSKQLDKNLTWPNNVLSIPEIIQWYDLANDINSWNVALVLYTFENINGLFNAERTWSIDDVTSDSWDKIIDLQHKYYNL